MNQCRIDNLDENVSESNISPKMALSYLTKVQKPTMVSSLSHDMTDSREKKRKLSIKKSYDRDLLKLKLGRTS
jgi:hypothetical protein